MLPPSAFFVKSQNFFFIHFLFTRVKPSATCEICAQNQGFADQTETSIFVYAKLPIFRLVFAVFSVITHKRGKAVVCFIAFRLSSPGTLCYDMLIQQSASCFREKLFLRYGGVKYENHSLPCGISSGSAGNFFSLAQTI